nr:hypothetical protein [Glaciibacter superstes]
MDQGLVSKPPAAEVEKKVLTELEQAGKPVIVYFIGGSQTAVTAAGGHFAGSSRDAASQAVRLAGNPDSAVPVADAALATRTRAKLAPGQRYVRGLFCGDTLCDETMYALLRSGEEVFSNIQKDPAGLLRPGGASRGHTFIDFGADEFTNGRPHPMIDPSLRLERLVKEAAAPPSR